MVLFTVVGFKYRHMTPRVMLTTKSITLEPESTNEVDPNAVKVLCDNIHVGYVTAEECYAIRKLLQTVPKYTISVVAIYAASAKCNYLAAT